MAIEILSPKASAEEGLAMGDDGFSYDGITKVSRRMDAYMSIRSDRRAENDEHLRLSGPNGLQSYEHAPIRNSTVVV